MNVAAKILIGVLVSVGGLVWVQHHSSKLRSVSPATNQQEVVQFSPSDSAKPSPATKFSSKRRVPVKGRKPVTTSADKRTSESQRLQEASAKVPVGKGPVMDKPAE